MHLELFVSGNIAVAMGKMRGAGLTVSGYIVWELFGSFHSRLKNGLPKVAQVMALWNFA